MFRSCAESRRMAAACWCRLPCTVDRIRTPLCSFQGSLRDGRLHPGSQWLVLSPTLPRILKYPGKGRRKCKPGSNPINLFTQMCVTTVKFYRRSSPREIGYSKNCLSTVNILTWKHHADRFCRCFFFTLALSHVDAWCHTLGQEVKNATYHVHVQLLFTVYSGIETKLLRQLRMLHTKYQHITDVAYIR